MFRIDKRSFAMIKFNIELSWLYVFRKVNCTKFWNINLYIFLCVCTVYITEFYILIVWVLWVVDIHWCALPGIHNKIYVFQSNSKLKTNTFFRFTPIFHPWLYNAKMCLSSFQNFSFIRTINWNIWYHRKRTHLTIQT